jgi:hypothetical protein
MVFIQNVGGCQFRNHLAFITAQGHIKCFVIMLDGISLELGHYVWREAY